MIFLGIFIGLIILIIGGIITYYAFEDSNNKVGIISLTTTIVLTIITAVATTIFLTSTESGKREIKDIKSDWNGGLHRTVTVYDVNGKEIQKYEGKFDVSCDDNRIKFDDENGERHIIYYTTGTVIIDEKQIN